MSNFYYGPALETELDYRRTTLRQEGILAFYKGLGTNALRILPGTCTTFVVYENLVWAFRRIAGRREAKAAAAAGAAA